MCVCLNVLVVVVVIVVVVVVVVVAAFFSILHSWLNAFAEMLRFADRLFYKVCFMLCHYHNNNNNNNNNRFV